MTDNTWTVEPRYTGFIKYQSGGLSFIHCRDIEGPVRFFTIDATGEAALNATVTFELDPYCIDLRFAANVVVEPSSVLPDDINDLIDQAEILAEGLETGAIMFLTDFEAGFMGALCQHGPVCIPLSCTGLVAMVTRLEAGGLVTIERRAADVVVSAVRPGED